MYKTRWVLAILLLSYLGFFIWYVQYHKPQVKVALETAPQPREVFAPDWEKLYYASKAGYAVVGTLVVDCPKASGTVSIYLVDGKKEVYIWTAGARGCGSPQTQQRWALQFDSALRQFGSPPSKDCRIVLKPVPDEDDGGIVLREVKLRGILPRD